MRNRGGLIAEVCKDASSASLKGPSWDLVAGSPNKAFVLLPPPLITPLCFVPIEMFSYFLSVLPLFMKEGQVMVQKDVETDEIKSSDQSHGDVWQAKGQHQSQSKLILLH